MGPPLNNFTAPDEYSEGVGYLYCPRTALVIFRVFNQAIFWRRGFAPPGGLGIQWDDYEEFLPPGYHPLGDRCDAVQVRAAVPAAKLAAAGKLPAQVTIATRTPAEVA